MSSETVKVTQSITMIFTSKPKSLPPPIDTAKLEVIFSEDENVEGWTMTFIRPSNAFHPCQVENLAEVIKIFQEMNDDKNRDAEEAAIAQSVKSRLDSVFGEHISSVPQHLKPEVCQILFDAATEIDAITKTKNGRTALYNNLASVAGKHLPESSS